MKFDWHHTSTGIIASLTGSLLAGIIGLSIAHAAPADQPASNAPANEQPLGQTAPNADTGTKPLAGPPNPLEESPSPAPSATGRNSVADPAPLQGPLGAPPKPEAAKPESSGHMPGPNPFETQPSAEEKTPEPGKSPSSTPESPTAPTPPQTEKPKSDQPSTPAAEQPKNPSAEQPTDETYTPSQQAVRTGIALIQKEKYEEALGHFDEALKLDPNEGAAYFYRGVSLRLLNRLDEAIDAFTTSIELTTDDLDAQAENYLRRGIAWFCKGEYIIAWQDFDDAGIYAKETDPRPDFWKGLSFARQNKLLDAVNAYAVAVEHDDHYAPAFVNLGLAYLGLDEPNKAVFCFDQAIRLDSHNASHYFKRGVALTKTGKLREAADSYSHAIRINPDYAEAYFNRSVINRRLGDQQQADKDRAAAIKIKPDVEKQLTGTS
jgi:tetratricopeptide (TPR) repeat protein